MRHNCFQDALGVHNSFKMHWVSTTPSRPQGFQLPNCAGHAQPLQDFRVFRFKMHRASLNNVSCLTNKWHVPTQLHLVYHGLNQGIWLIMSSDTHPFLLQDFWNFRMNSFEVAKSSLKNVYRCLQALDIQSPNKLTKFLVIVPVDSCHWTPFLLTMSWVLLVRATSHFLCIWSINVHMCHLLGLLG